MRAVLGILFLFVLAMASARAEEIWFALDPAGYPVPRDADHYPSADAACRVAYANDVVKFTSEVSFVLPYVGAIFFPPETPPYLYDCNTQVDIAGTPFTSFHLVEAVGDECADGKTLDLVAGKCISSDEQQDWR